MRVLLFFARIPLLMFALGALVAVFWILSELVGDSRMIETSGTVVEAESVSPGSSLSPPERADMPCRYASGSGFWAGFSRGWFIVEHDDGAVLFCSGAREVGTEINLWVHPSNAWDGRLVAPTFTMPQAILWLIVSIILVGLFTWAWVRAR